MDLFVKEGLRSQKEFDGLDLNQVGFTTQTTSGKRSNEKLNEFVISNINLIVCFRYTRLHTPEGTNETVAI